MALTKCHDCGREISATAKICPQCGAATLYYKSKTCKFRLVSFTIIISVCLMGLFSYFLYVNKCVKESVAAAQKLIDNEYPPKPNSYFDYNQIHKFFNSLPDHNQMNNPIYTLNESDFKKYLTDVLDARNGGSDSITFQESYTYRNWESIRNYFRDYDSRWEEFSFTISE